MTRLVWFAAGAVAAVVAAWVCWQLLWAAATEQAYGRRWADE